MKLNKSLPLVLGAAVAVGGCESAAEREARLADVQARIDVTADGIASCIERVDLGLGKPNQRVMDHLYCSKANIPVVAYDEEGRYDFQKVMGAVTRGFWGVPDDGSTSVSREKYNDSVTVQSIGPNGAVLRFDADLKRIHLSDANGNEVGSWERDILFSLSNVSTGHKLSVSGNDLVCFDGSTRSYDIAPGRGNIFGEFGDKRGRDDEKWLLNEAFRKIRHEYVLQSGNDSSALCKG